MPRSRRPERVEQPLELGAILEEMVVDPKLAAGMLLGSLARRWAEVVGERLSAECAPVGIDGRMLVIRASSAAWATQIRFLAREVARGSNAILGKGAVDAVRVVVWDARGGSERGA